MAKRLSQIVIGFVGAVATCSLQAKEVRPGQERFEFLLGAFLPAFDSGVKINGDVLEGDHINLGNELGVDQDESGVIAGFQWRFKEKHRIGFSYSNFKLHGRRDIDEEITIGDTTYPIAATVRTEQKLEIIPITYSYSFINNEGNEFAATAGVHWTSVTLDILGETADQSFEATSRANANLPLPLLGVRYERHISPNWTVGVAASLFSIEFGEGQLDAKGSLGSLRAFGEYHFGNRYSAGLGVDAFKLTLEADKPKWNGDLDYSYWGPQLYLVARF